MNIDVLIQHMEKKLVTLREKMDVASEKCAFELHTTFSNEYNETQITLYLLNKATQDIQYYTNKEVRDKLIQYIVNNAVREKVIEYVLSNLPDLAFYFKTESINTVVTDIVGKAYDNVIAPVAESAYDKLEEEYFKGKVVNLIEKI
jgi:GTPase Era involved in 16S rRNA processing